MGVPHWGFLRWRGRLGRGVPRGETKTGEARHRPLLPPQQPSARAGELSSMTATWREHAHQGKEPLPRDLEPDLCSVRKFPCLPGKLALKNHALCAINGV